MNTFKPLLRIAILLAAMLTMLGVGVILGWNLRQRPIEEYVGTRDTTTTQELLLSGDALWKLVLGYKSSVGQGYTQDANLCEIANIRVEQIRSIFSHEQFTRDGPGYLSAYGFTNIGENLSKDSRDVHETLVGWLVSPDHRKALDSKIYTHSCIRCKGSYCVQIFGAYK